MSKTPFPLAGLALLTTLASPSSPAPPIDTFDVECVLAPARVVDVGVPVSGIVRELHVELGDRVEPGQLLAELDAEVERASLALEEARAARSADLASAEEELQRARRQQEQVMRLRGEGIVSQEALDEAASLLRQAELDVLRSQEELDQARLQVELARARLEQRSLRAPVAGQVTELRLDPGELASPGGEGVLLRLVQLDPLVVDVPTPLFVRSSLEPGDLVQVRASRPGAPWRKARVRALDPHVDPVSETFRVRLELPNPGDVLPAGLVCTVRFEL